MLVTVKIITRSICFTGLAFLLKNNSAMAGVLNLFYLVGRRFIVFPNVYKAIARITKPITVLGFFLTCKNCKDYNGKGYEYFFHIHKI